MKSSRVVATAIAAFLILPLGSFAGPPKGSVAGRGAAAGAPADPDAACGIRVSCIDARTLVPFEFRAERLLASGVADGEWSPDSSRLCLGSLDGLTDKRIPDGAGGALVAWVDGRSGDADIYLQHFSSSGSIATGWPAGGLPVCQARYSQYALDLTSDVAGGAFLAWQDFRLGRAGEIYAQHITASGQLAAGWPADGRVVCSSTAEQTTPRVAADGSGGVLVVWQDRRAGSLDVYVQHLLSSGEIASGWPAEGAELAGGPGNQVAPSISGDVSGQVTVIWRSEGDPDGMSIWAVQVPPGAVPGVGWLQSPSELAHGEPALGDPIVASSNDGATLVVWSSRHGPEAELRAQRLSSSGAPAWTSGGRVLMSAGGWSDAPQVLPDSSGGAVIGWEDHRYGDESDIFAQKIAASGEIATGWDPNGMAICVASGNQYSPQLASDGAGGVLATWADDASAAQAGYLSLASSTLSDHVHLSEATAKPGHAHLVWRIDSGMTARLMPYRRSLEVGWQALQAVVADDSGRVVVDDRDAPEGQRVEYRLSLIGEDVVVNLQPVALDIPRAPDRLALHRAWLPAAHNTIAASIALPRGVAAGIELLDVAGRRLSSLSLAGLEPGEQIVRFNTPDRLASGVYFVRLRQGQQALVAKLVILR